jgi:histidine ammonia-lyase
VTVIVDTRADFGLANYRRVALDGESVAIGPQAMVRMSRAREAFVQMLESDRDVFIYQTTSGGGPLASIAIPPEEQLTRARLRQVRPSLGDSFGESDLPDRVVRGIIFARLADYVEGHAKSRPVVAQEIAALLDRPMPRVPLGGVTGSGEIVALAHVLGEIRSMTFEEGEFDSLSNGSPCSAALVADAALHAAERARLAIAVFALSARAFAYLPDVPATRVALGDDRHAIQALEEFAAWLEPSNAPARTAPASYRVLPSLLGQAMRVAEQAAEVAEISLRSVKNNPAYVAPDDAHPAELVLHNGGYHDAGAGPAMDGLSLAWANLCALVDLQVTKLHTGDLSGLPDMLARDDQDAWSTTAMLGFIPIGFGERARQAATPTMLPVSEGGGYGGQDDVSLGTFIAYEKQQTAARQLEGALAVLATTACQAFAVSERSPGAHLRPLAELVRSHVTFEDPERPRLRGEQMATVADAFAAMVLAGRRLPVAAVAGTAPAAPAEDHATDSESAR